MEWLAVYDIADPKRLRRVARVMQRFGVRVQKSVFECNLATSALTDMKTAALGVMEEAEDSLRIYPLLDNSRSKQTILGCGVVAPFPTAYIL